jgi:hypothetical protein
VDPAVAAVSGGHAIFIDYLFVPRASGRNRGQPEAIGALLIRRW